MTVMGVRHCRANEASTIFPSDGESGRAERWRPRVVICSSWVSASIDISLMKMSSHVSEEETNVQI